MPTDVIKAKITPCRCHGKPWRRSRLQNLDDHDIVRIHGAEYRGIVNYYLLAQDVRRLKRLRWHAETSFDDPSGPGDSGSEEPLQRPS